MNLFTAAQMRAADRDAMQAGIPSLLLMEEAGRAVAREVLEHWPGAKPILVLCGKGNNGGDGYVAARHLFRAGREVLVLEAAAGPEDLASDDARSARAACLAWQVPCAPLEPAGLAASLTRPAVVIDALFGSGLSRPLEGAHVGFVEAVNAAALPVLSIDVPSGLSADTPVPPGPHVQATRTVQLAGAKVASALYPARTGFGVWTVADIGIPAAILDRHAGLALITGARAAAAAPGRTPDAHKFTAGTVLVIGGSDRYLGAAELTCRAAYRAGAGLVTLASPSPGTGSWPEIVRQPLVLEAPGGGLLNGLERKRRQALVLGPGLHPETLVFLPPVIAGQEGPLVVDASALVPTLRDPVRAHGRAVLTPHVGEAARLLGTRSKEVLAKPVDCARHLASTWRAIVVLKNATTVIAAPDGRAAISDRGHPGMATGGSGDVLAGVLGAWLASVGSSEDLFERTAAAVYLHGCAGMRAGERLGSGLVASDLVRELPGAWRDLILPGPSAV